MFVLFHFVFICIARDEWRAMAEIIGTTLGVVGFLGQLFDGCVKAYGYFTTASNLDTDSQRMMCKVRIEEMRLVVWGREWGVAEGKLEAHLDSERNPQLRALATQILEELHGTVTNFNKLRERYGLVDSEGVMATPEKTKKKGEKDVGLAGAATWPKDAKTSNGKTNGERGWKKELSLRTRWVIQGLLDSVTHSLTHSLAPTHANSYQTRTSSPTSCEISKVTLPLTQLTLIPITNMSRFQRRSRTSLPSISTPLLPTSMDPSASRNRPA